jgi:RNA polymerase sigma-70 factor (ECF subfamily)
LKSLKEGNEKAFEEIFKNYYPHMVLFAMRFLHDKDLSESIVQEVFVRLWEKRKNGDIQSLKNYLVVSVRNRCHNELKRQGVVRDYEKKSVQEVASWPVFKDKEYLERINQTIDSLPVQRKKIFKMSRLEGLKYKEIANQLGISPKTVEAQMGKALKYLREQLYPLKKQILS